MRKILLKSLKLSPLVILGYAYCSTKQLQQDIYGSGLRNFKGFKKRQQHIKDVQKNPNYDIVIIGGGASGTGACLDASTRGLRTLLIEKSDFGAGTSSKSTKLLHGGVRYLQQVFELSTQSLMSRYEKFKLVKQAIKQRGVLLRNAAYMNEKIPFVIPTTGFFSTAYYYIGSIFYYAIYLFQRQTNTVKFNFPYFLHRNQLREFFPYISDKYQGGVVYQDGCFNDARLLLMSLLTCTLNKQQYQYLPNGHCPANILNRAQFLDFQKDSQGKIKGITFKDTVSQKVLKVNAKYVVNCSGAWADKIRLKDNPNSTKRICIVAGSHITYDWRISSNRFGLCLPSKDGRVMLVVPWLGRVIVGTTEKKLDQPELNPTISSEQRKLIQTQMGQLMDKISPQSLIDYQISRWTGLRPLVLADQAKSTKDIARNHIIERSSSGLYSLMGGKWTTYRKMGQDLLDFINKYHQQQTGKRFASSISQNILLVGSCSPHLKNKLIQKYGGIGKHLYQNYGSLANQIVKGDLTPINGNVTNAQINYILNNQMVNDIDDVVLRRIRLAFLNQRQNTLSFIPYISRQILKVRNQKITQKQTQKFIKQNIQKILKYQFD